MAFSFERDEPVGDGVRRIAAAEIDKASAELGGERHDDLLKVAFDVTTTDEEIARRFAGTSEPRRSGAA